MSEIYFSVLKRGKLLLAFVALFGWVFVTVLHAADNHTCEGDGSVACKDTGDLRGEAFFEENGKGGADKCTGTGCHFCNSSNSRTTSVCVYLEGGTCSNTYKELNCGNSTVSAADKCTWTDTLGWNNSCGCDNAKEDTEADTCQLKTYKSCDE